jgi:predicted transcriptional regulator
MTTLTVDLPDNVYERLHAAAQRRQTTIEAIVQEWLAEKSIADLTLSEREHATAALRAAGLLTELSAAEKERAARSTLTLDEARAILDRAGGKPLSEIILEMRGPKE